MTLVHTIKINDEKSSKSTVSSTRKSQSRRYEACLVVTTTKRSLEIDAAAKAETERKLAEARAEVARLSAKYDMTVEEADAEHEARSEAWYGREGNDGEGYFDICRRLREGMSDQERISYYRGGSRRQSIEDKAKAELKERGLTDPFDKDTSYALYLAGHEVRCQEGRLERWEELREGSQAVISWHTTVDNARKALGSPSKVGYWERRGDTVELRTDIEVRQTGRKS